MLNRGRFCLGLILAFGLLGFLPVRLNATDIVQTIAGGGSLESYKPGEANLLLGNSAGLAINAIGEVLVSDSGHNQVLKVNPTTGLITIIAGNGTAAYFGDGTPATSAGLNNPGGLAIDSAGNLFIADRANFVVRRVDGLSGVITTVAGNGLFTGQVVGTNPPAALGDGLAATSATFGTMGDIILDASGAIIVADSGNACVRKFTIGGTIATIAGTPGNSGFAGDAAAGGAITAVQLNAPTGLAVDGSGNIYIADSGNRRVRKLDATNTVNTIAGSGAGGNTGFDGDGGVATSAQIGSLGGLAINKDGTLLICCVGANRIRRVDIASAAPVILTIAGNGATTIGDLGPATGASFSGPRDVAVDAAGNIFIYDTGDGRVRRIDAKTGFIDTVIGTGLRGFIGDRGPNQGGVLVGPKGAAFDASGNLYVADTGDNAVRKVATDGTITTFAGNGVTAGLGDGGPANLASLSAPQDVLVLGTTLLIADNGHNAIRAVDLTTNIITTYVGMNRPVAMVSNASGVYVAHDNQIDLIAPDKTVTTYAGGNPVNTVANPNGDGLPPDSARLRSPSGLALGPGGELYIADTNANLIRLISAPPTSVTSTIAGGGTNVFPSVGDGGPALSATLNGPTGVTIDAAGRLIISDTGNNRIRVMDLAALTINAYVGNGTAGFSGDGDVIATALVNLPGKVFLNAGSLVFVDTGNNRVRQIISATDIDPKLLSFSAKLAFTIDKKTGQLVLNKDAVALKAGLPLPAGIAAANLKISVDIVDLHQSVQLDASGKMPKAVKAAKASKVTPLFDFALPHAGPPPVSKFSLALKGTSVAGAKPASFSFASKGTFREELGRAGFTDVTTAKDGVNLPVRVDISLGTTTFTGLTTVQWKATQGKGGAAKSIKTK